MLLFALKTLVADRGKLIIALAGVVFSLVLINVQGGLFLGLVRKASLLVDNSDADIWIGHRGVDNADIPANIPEAWLDRIRGLPGVIRAEPYIVASAIMTLPNGDFEGVMIVGSDPASMLGSAWVFSQGSRQDLSRPDSIALDELDAWRLGNPKIGDTLEVSGKRARLVATTRGILGFITTPYLFTTLEHARQYAQIPEGYCSYYLVQAADGLDLEDLRHRIRQRVPDLDVYTAAEFSRKSRIYWTVRTGVGMSFGASTVLGLLVGLVMVAQSLYALALDHLDDYATLKAIGAEDRHVYYVLLLQGTIIALVGTAIGVVIIYLVQFFLSTPYVPIEISRWILLGAVALAATICLMACILPFGRIRRVDPATILQG